MYNKPIYGDFMAEKHFIKHLVSLLCSALCSEPSWRKLSYNFISHTVWYSHNTNRPGETKLELKESSALFFPGPSSGGTATDCSPFKLSPHGGDAPTPAMGSEFLPTSDSFVSMETNPPTGPIKKYLVNFSMRASHCGLRSGSLWMLIRTARPT